MNEWKQLYHARKWMKNNETFLPTWHAYVGYKLSLFEVFEKPITAAKAAEKHALDETLLMRWVEVGVAVGHLDAKRSGKVKSKKEVLKYIAPSSSASVGALLKEMMELHIPTLLNYPGLMTGESRMDYQAVDFGATVAETSSYLEKLAFPMMLKYMKKQNGGTVLDIGCGYGGYLARIHEKQPQMNLIGLEVHDGVIQQAEERFDADNQNVRFVHGDFTAYGDGAFQADFVMMNNLLYYFEPKDRGELLQKAATWVEKGGKLFIITPLGDAEHGKAFAAAFNSFMSAHSNLYPLPTSKELKQDGKAAGLKLKQLDPVVKEGGWYFIAFEKK
ncbi:methyltransferase family protein [Salsuginibacillus halophilus]|uniref:Methyltransferase family protein n=1 Tax=Salsuginibacillus halophilus TaxID=517424 RepID=A0A2P8HY26_9BACI|nr:class I SAM-dependent methyltransferase [Salsuginibacillus halophilus]PSL51130.1 methyltransferase family protein [Salsuginibacillus halophilus]